MKTHLNRCYFIFNNQNYGKFDQGSHICLDVAHFSYHRIYHSFREIVSSGGKIHRKMNDPTAFKKPWVADLPTSLVLGFYMAVMWYIHDIMRDQSRYSPSQWETSLQCNDISHWLGTYLDWSLHNERLEQHRHHFVHDIYQIHFLAWEPLYFDWAPVTFNGVPGNNKGNIDRY